MSSPLIYVHPSSPYNPDDADIGVRLGIALTKQQQAGWRDIYVAVRGGVVTLEGEVSTPRDRRFVVAVARHVVGASRINDKLTVVDKRSRKPTTEAEIDSSLSEKYRARPKTGKPADHFKHVPVLSESLEDISAPFIKNTSTQS